MPNFILPPARKRQTALVRALALVLAGHLSVSAALAAGQVPPPTPGDSHRPSSIADVHDEPASDDVREVANWVIASRDNHALPFIVIDKVQARVFVFDRTGGLRGAAPALLGIGRGDDSVPGIGHRKLATIAPAERTTPAGRFEASLGNDFEQDLLWVDYDTSLSLHRVIVGNPRDRRAERLASASVLDNRISYGCINVPPAFYDTIVMPAFKGTVGVVYILPESKPLRAVFPIPERQPLQGPALPTAR